ncbi:MAG: hypothetical protein JW808_01880 [Victivallales bacterium]|nr:hypothetical protein [Victivallales bacterium]
MLVSMAISELPFIDPDGAVLVDSFFFFRPSTMALVWILIYSSDWVMNYWGTRLYYGQVRKFCIFEQGYNLKHITVEEMERPGRLLLRYFSELFLTTFALWLLLYTCRLYSGWRIYELICGYFILMEACVHFRHIRCVTVFTLMKPGHGFYGSIAIPKWISLRNAFIEFATFGIGFLLVFFFYSTNFFVLGGVLACLTATLYNFSISEQARRRFVVNSSEVANADAPSASGK